MPFNLQSYLFFKSNDLPVIGSDSGLNATVPVALEPDPTKEFFFVLFYLKSEQFMKQNDHPK